MRPIYDLDASALDNPLRSYAFVFVCVFFFLLNFHMRNIQMPMTSIVCVCLCILLHTLSESYFDLMP